MAVAVFFLVPDVCERGGTYIYFHSISLLFRFCLECCYGIFPCVVDINPLLKKTEFLKRLLLMMIGFWGV